MRFARVAPEQVGLHPTLNARDAGVCLFATASKLSEGTAGDWDPAPNIALQTSVAVCAPGGSMNAGASPQAFRSAGVFCVWSGFVRKSYA